MQVKTPDLGVESADVAEIMVKIGDLISDGDNIVLLESDKASVEVPSNANGKVTQILVAIGDKVSEGVPLIELESADSAATVTEEPVAPASKPQEESQTASQEAASTIQQTAVAAQSESQTYNLPDLGVDSADVAEIMVNVGDTVDENQPIVLVESDKASVEVPAPIAGVVEAILLKVGDKVQSAQAFVTIKSTKDTNVAAPQPAAEPIAASSTTESKPKAIDTPSTAASGLVTSNNSLNKLNETEVNARLANVYAGPAVRKLARQLGVDITTVSGTAAHGRIVKEDLFEFVKARLSGAQHDSNATTGYKETRSGLPLLPDMSNQAIWGDIEQQELTRLQKVSIPQLNYNTYLPQVTQFDLADITDTESLRNELKGEFKAQGIGLTILAFIVKATAYALTQHPKFNSHISDDNTHILIRKSVNMGIAVATDDGLIVPVIKDAQAKGIKQIAIEIGELAAKARDKKLSAKELQGASFTISSQGNLGGTAFTPLVNWPQVGILGVSEASFQPRWNAAAKTFEPRLMLPLSLSYDHRVINGADAAVFTRYLAKLLSDPRRILL